MIAVALALAAAVAGLPVLECPPGAELRGAAPPDGTLAWCERADPLGRALRDGPARTWYDDGGLWLDERFRAGERDGPSVEYHRGGKKAREGGYAAGRKHGPWTIWYAGGALEEESEWRAGVSHGRFAAYWRSGKKKTEGRHCGGVACGIWRTWDEGGALLGTVEYTTPSLTP